MPKQIEFFLDIVSPTSYLAFTQVASVAMRTGARIIYRPVLLGGILKATGNSTPLATPAKGTNLMRDVERYAEHYGVPYKANPHFPFNSVTIMRCAAACESGSDLQRYLQALFEATWAKGFNVGDETVLRKVISDAGFNADELLMRALSPEVKQALMASTEEAVRRGAFGAPTFFVGDEMFFGQDRLAMAEKYAKA